MPVLISSEIDLNTYNLSLQALAAIAEKLLNLSKRTDWELSILLVSDQRMAELNGQYRKKPVPTNVLAFPMDDEPDKLSQTMLGDIVISVDTAIREAAQESISPLERIVKLLIHGFLHLLGHDHERSDEEDDFMRAEEKKNHQRT
ncbi:MAG: rRNA maturation RNase YbeY [Proteobacteria bacterium]|nr:rRNA maturation RNase YbeY [Pseudomonadota bacterium]